MQYQLIPSTSLSVSPICLGTMTFGTPVDKAQAVEIVHRALGQGVNFIDTANMYEGYARVLGSAGGVAEDLVDFSDFLPTVLETVGLPVPSGLDGRSFLARLKGRRDYQPRSWIYIYYNPRPERTRPQRFVRDQRFKLYGNGRFFDVANDVQEQQQLVEFSDDPVAVAAHRRMKAALASMPRQGQSLLKFVR